jgi:hypothetical protein
MTQKTYSVSPKPSARLKPGTHLPGLRPSDSGDTAAHVAQISQSASAGELCASVVRPFRSFQHQHIRASVLDCDGPTSLFHASLRAFCESTARFHVSILHPATSQNPHGTASFCTVPRNQIFSFPLFFVPSCPAALVAQLLSVLVVVRISLPRPLAFGFSSLLCHLRPSREAARLISVLACHLSFFPCVRIPIPGASIRLQIRNQKFANQKSAPSFHPHGTALFCAVPRNEIFSFPSSLWLCALCGRAALICHLGLVIPLSFVHLSLGSLISPFPRSLRRPACAGSPRRFLGLIQK